MILTTSDSIPRLFCYCQLHLSLNGYCNWLCAYMIFSCLWNILVGNSDSFSYKKKKNLNILHSRSSFFPFLVTIPVLYFSNIAPKSFFTWFKELSFLLCFSLLPGIKASVMTWFHLFSLLCRPKILINSNKIQSCFNIASLFSHHCHSR